MLSATSATPTGYLDTVNATVIRGWAYQSDIPNTVLRVHIYIINSTTNEETKIDVWADKYRADLAAAGYGNGYHGFEYNISWLGYKPGTYIVRAYAIGGSAGNPQLYNSPKNFTVRSMYGAVDSVNRNEVRGWVWKPDAPNESVEAHIYIRKSNGDVADVYIVEADDYRADLAALGYGNGYHGFTAEIDWSALPEDKLQVTVYMVDNTGVHPTLYNGYYKNLPIHLIGMIDDKGVNFSTWATQEVINYAENIGARQVKKCIGATEEDLVEYVHDSRFSVVYTHGEQHAIKWSKNANTDSGTSGALTWREVNALDVGYLSNIDCLLLLACSTASDSDGPNNIAESFKSKGIGTVVAFKRNIVSAVSNGVTVKTTLAAGLWGKVFVRELGNGSTVKAAKETAFDKMLEKQLKEFDIKKEDIEERLESDPDFVNRYIYCGMDSCVILGDENQIIKQ